MSIATSWTDIDWFKAKRNLSELQYRILKAYREKDLAKARKAQNRLVRSFAAKSLAVRKVTSLRLLHRDCHKQVTNSKNENLLATWRSENIIY